MERLSNVQAGMAGGPALQLPAGLQIVAADRRRFPRVEIPGSQVGFAYAMRAFRTSAPLALSDLMTLLGAWAVARAASGLIVPVGVEPLAGWLLLLGVGVIAANATHGLYPGIGLDGVSELRQSATAVLLLFGVVALTELVRGESAGHLFILLTVGGVTAVAMPMSRALTRCLCGRFSWWRHPMLVLGSGPASRDVSEYFRSHPGMGLTPITMDLGREGLPQPAAIASLARRHHATCAALPLEGRGTDAGERFLIRYCAGVFPNLWVIPAPGMLPTRWTGATDVGGVIGIQSGTRLLRPVPRAVKRLMDCLLAGLLGVLSLPFLVIIGAAIKLTSPGPVFYGHRRVGRGRRMFNAWKFRTMHVKADELLEAYLASDPKLRKEWVRSHKLRADPRITAIGRLLRKTSLDELPQLWNVIRGEMSLVGPRPIVPKEIPRYGEDFGLYLAVPPGLTGLWQVSGRNRTTYAERVGFDSYYVRNWSVWLDLHILARTVPSVLTGDGAV